MSIFHRIKSIIKKDSQTPEKEIKRTKAKEQPLKEKGVVEVKQPVPSLSKKPVKDTDKILKHPHISEKATYLSEQNKYVFKVFDSANKIQIKNAISGLYGVKVRHIRIINEKSKSRKLRNFFGTKPGYKKAIVTLEKGYKIEVLPH